MCEEEQMCLYLDILVGWGGERDSNRQLKNHIPGSIMTKKTIKEG